MLNAACGVEGCAKKNNGVDDAPTSRADRDQKLRLGSDRAYAPCTRFRPSYPTFPSWTKDHLRCISVNRRCDEDDDELLELVLVCSDETFRDLLKNNEDNID